MMGVVYLFLCFTVGWGICTYAFPDLRELTQNSYHNKKIFFSPYLLLFPAWYITGTLVLTWVTYISAMFFAESKKPLLPANAISITIAFLFTIFVIIQKGVQFHKEHSSEPWLSFLQSRMDSLGCSDKRTRRLEYGLLMSIILLASILMWTTFFVNGDQLYVGVSVFSDFSPHIGMIRSFSYGNNFPTAYSHFAGEDIRYHFMFQFLVGNLEFLGMRIDYAFNIPSILSFISAFLMLYLLAVKITAKISAGILACVFFAFRSAKTLFTYLSKLPKGTDIWQSLIGNTQFIGDTPNEDWGLWNLNVYCNQRHLALGLAVIFFVILLFLPRLYEMFAKVRGLYIGVPIAEDVAAGRITAAETAVVTAKMAAEEETLAETMSAREDHRAVQVTWWDKCKALFFSKDAWLVQNFRLPIAAGILLGSLSFFHGAALIACLLVLFGVAILSTRRLEFLILAGIAIGMSMIQSSIFINGSAVSPDYAFGFIAENKTLFGAASYLERLLGLLPLVLLAAFCLAVWEERHLLIAFVIPMIFAFTVSLTTDVTVNHKYIMISCILLGIFAADLIMKMWERRDIVIRMTGVLLIIALTSTGVFDFNTILKKDIPESAIVLNLKDPLTKWIRENSDSKDIFLTSSYSLNQVVLGGAMLYQGWPYYAWSAGYDTDYRGRMVKKMYEAQTPEELDALVRKNHIGFIIVDQENRSSKDYQLKEETIRAAYSCVYEQGEGDWKTSIYDTQQPIFQ